MAYGAILGQKTNTYNKEQIMTSETAALFGLGTDAVPDNILELLGNNIYNGLGNQYLWEKQKETYKYEAVIDSSNSRFVAFSTTVYEETYDLQYSNSINIDESGKITLYNPMTITISYSNWKQISHTLLGKYYKTSSGTIVKDVNTITYPDTSTDASGSPTTYTCYIWGRLVTTKKSLDHIEYYGYVNSSSPDAYPPTEPDGYTYTALGQLGGFAKIETGSYTGTGTYGSSNPNTLTFEFEPKILIISSPIINEYSNITIIYATRGGVSISGPISSGGSTQVTPGMASSINNNTVYFYNNTSASRQKNESGILYDYLAIG